MAVFLPKLSIRKVERKGEVCSLCGERGRYWVALVWEWKNVRGAVAFCHKECLLLLLKKLFPKDMRVSKRVRMRGLTRRV